MKHKIYLTILLGLFLIGNVFALDNIGNTKRVNDVVTISQICSDATYITISSIQPPTGYPINLIVNMTYIGGGEFQYNFSDTNLVGRYDVRGTSDGCGGSFTTYFEISSGTNDGSITLFIFLYVLFYGITILGLLRRHVWITLGGCFGLLILGVFTGSNGFGIYKNGLTDAVSYITILIGLGLGFETVYEITNY